MTIGSNRVRDSWQADTTENINNSLRDRIPSQPEGVSCVETKERIPLSATHTCACDVANFDRNRPPPPGRQTSHHTPSGSTGRVIKRAGSIPFSGPSRCGFISRKYSPEITVVALGQEYCKQVVNIRHHHFGNKFIHVKCT